MGPSVPRDGERLQARDKSVSSSAPQRAAQTLETLSEDVAAVAARRGLTSLPGSGRDLAACIEKYLATGRIAQFDSRRTSRPASSHRPCDLGGSPNAISVDVPMRSINTSAPSLHSRLMEDNPMRQGSVDIVKVGNAPELYVVTFATSEGPNAGQAARSFTRLEEVDEFLQQAGIPSDRIRPALGRVRQDGTASIPNLALEDRELHDLGLLTSSGTGAQPDGGGGSG
jgi:hypothetical protein